MKLQRKSVTHYYSIADSEKYSFHVKQFLTFMPCSV